MRNSCQIKSAMPTTLSKRHALDEDGGKPVVLLALLEHGLERAEAEGEKENALPIDVAVLARVRDRPAAERWWP